MSMSETKKLCERSVALRNVEANALEPGKRRPTASRRDHERSTSRPIGKSGVGNPAAQLPFRLNGAPAGGCHPSNM